MGLQEFMNKEELTKELKEIEEVKLPLVEEKIKDARKLGQLSENVAYSDAREEKASLQERIEEIKDILIRGNIRQDYKDLLEAINSDSFNNNLQPIRDFFKTYHKGEFYYPEEASILLSLNKLRGRYLVKGLEPEADRLFDLQMEMLSLTKEDDDKEIYKLCESWDILFDTVSSLDDDLFGYDLDKMSEDEYKNIFKPLEDVINSTRRYFVKKKDNLFTHSELYLINHIYVSLLPSLSNEPNKYYYKLTEMFDLIIER